MTTILPEAQRRRARNLAELEEINHRSFSLEEIAASIKAYQPRATDIIITPYAKSGTTWLQQIFHTVQRTIPR